MPELKPFPERAERIVRMVMGGEHHCEKVVKKTSPERWEITYYGSFATFDYNQLTRLVIAAHDNCVRAEVCSGGANKIKICLWPRLRDGGFAQRHPTMEQAIEEIRGDYEQYLD